MNELANINDRRMKVSEVAEALGCSPETVKSHIRKLWPDMMKNGVSTHLTEAQVTVILEKMKSPSSSGTLANLQSEIAGTETELTPILQLKMLNDQMQAIYQKEIDKLKAKIEADEDKVELAERMLLSEDVLSLEATAKSLKLPYGVIKFAAKLRDGGILMTQSWNLPYQKHVDAGYLVVVNVIKDCGGAERIFPTTRVTPRGLLWLSRTRERWDVE